MAKSWKWIRISRWCTRCSTEAVRTTRKKVQGAVRFRRTAPLPALWATDFQAFPPEGLFEMENNSSGNTQVVLSLIVGVPEFRQMRQHVVELQRTDRETITHVPVDAHATRSSARGVDI